MLTQARVSPESSLLARSVTALLDRGLVQLAITQGGLIREATGGFAAALGLSPSTCVGCPIAEFVADSDRLRIIGALRSLESMDSTIRRGFRGAGGQTLTFTAVRADGGSFPARVIVAPVAGGATRSLVLVLQDVSDEDRAERNLRALAFADPLTGLPNRASLYDQLRNAIIDHGTASSTFALLFCDLDGFKTINDTRGHDAGDAVLVAVGQRLRATLRDADVVARLGGDEFAIILHSTATRAAAAVAASRLLALAPTPIEVGGQTCQVGMSIGIAVYPLDGTNIDELLTHADRAMYRAKVAGKNCYAEASELACQATPASTELLGWGAYHDVGIRLIDTQHRGMVRLINRVAQQLKEGANCEQLRPTMRALRTFTARHFATEEQLIARSPGWPLERRHAEEHAKLLDQIECFCDEVAAQGMSVSLRFMQDWLTQHVETMDKPLGHWLASRGQH